jgi:hypothetical protein
MALFPFIFTAPIPKHISAPAIIDEVHRFTTDQSHEVRRAKHSRPRRRYVVEWRGIHTGHMRLIRDFLGTCRYGALPFEFLHCTALDTVTVNATSPVSLIYNTAHGLLTGQWIGVMSSPGQALNGFWQVTRIDALRVSLNGSVAQGSGPATTRVYLPQALAVFNADTWEAPVKLIGPEQNAQGWFNVSLTIEELF